MYRLTDHTVLKSELETQTIQISDQCDQLSDTTTQMSGVADTVVETVQPFYQVIRELTAAIHTIHDMGQSGVFAREERTYYLYMTWMSMLPQQWLQSFREMLDTQKMQPIQLEANESVFGQIYSVLTPNVPEALPLWEQVAKTHEELHEKGKELYRMCQVGNYAAGEAVYSKMEELSQSIMGQMQNVVKLQVKGDYSDVFKQRAAEQQKG